MKIFWLILLSITPIFAQTNLHKKALLIGIGQYETNSGWKKLVGDSDVELIQQTLINQGFTKENIITLTNQNAKKVAIETAFNNLINTFAKSNDKIVLFFSGHGTQVDDKNGDEKDDNRDEAIVPFDCKMKGNEKNLIIDDQIGDWIKKLREKVGKDGHIILFLNACHSGKASKGDDFSNNFEKSELNFIDNTPKLQKQAKFIAFEATTSLLNTDIINTPDNKNFGALSYSLAVAFENITKEETYQSLFKKVALKMAQKPIQQTPFLEGDNDDLNTKVFDGDIQEQSTVYKIKQYLGDKVKIAGGYLGNINLGSKFTFLLNNTKGDRNDTPVAQGTVIESNAFESIIEITNGTKLHENANLVGIQIEQTFANFKVAVAFKNFKDKTIQKSLEENLSKKNILTITNESPDLELIDGIDSIAIKTLPTGFLYAKFKKSGQFQQEIINKIIDFGRAKIITELQIDSPNYKAEISLKHSNNKEVIRNGVKKWECAFYEDAVHKNELVFDTTQESCFVIKNIGKETFYFTLIDIQPDGVMNVILPNETKKWDGEDLKIKSGEEKKFAFGTPTPPYGTEMYKIILSPNYEDFYFLSTQDRSSISTDKKGNENPVVALFKDLTEGSLQRTKGVLPFVGGTTELIFKIVPAPQ